MEVIKRSGKVVPYDVNRIRNAVLKCGKGAKISDPESLAKLVTQDLEDWITRQESTVSVEDIQDQVERALMSYDSDAAKHYILYRDERAELRAKRLTPDFNALADYVQRAKYARYSPEKQRRESWDEIVDRVITMHREKYPFLEDEIFDFVGAQMKEKRVLPAGRSLENSTPVPTPEGWKTVGEVQPGDYLFDEAGVPTRVLEIYPFEDIELFRVDFTDGESIVASGDHLWVTSTLDDRNPKKRVRAKYGIRTRVVTTDQIAKSLTQKSGDPKYPVKYNHVVWNAAPLQLPAQELIVDPYTLGYWLGNGDKHGGQFSRHHDDHEISDFITEAGYQAHKITANPHLWSTFGLATGLGKLGVLNNKHIPANYLRASIEQRLALLQGLMDSDGSISPEGRSSFTNTNPSIITGFCDLLASLGIKYIKVDVKPQESHHLDAWTVDFFTDLPVHRLSRKQNRIRPFKSKRTTHRAITNVQSLGYGNATCFLVDSPSHTFLAGERMVVTHNCSQFGGAALLRDNARGFNCTFSHFDRPEFVKEALFLLLCGCGVAYSVQKHHVAKLPSLVQINRQKVVHCTIADTKEGWADAAYELFKSYIEGYYVEFNYSKIRPAGAPLKTSGGRAPGHLGLRDALETCRGILHQAQGRRLRPFEAHLLVCTLADAVLSGGIRRASLLALFSPDDDEMLSCKTGEWWTKYPQLGNCNNSVATLRQTFTQEALHTAGDTLRKFGDPGFYMTESLEYGTNPCLSSDSLILTTQGYRSILELVDKPFTAITAVGKYDSSGFFKTGTKEVWRLTVYGQDGKLRYLKATENHKIGTPNGWIKVGDLVPDQVIYCHEDGSTRMGELIDKQLVGVEDVYNCSVEEVHEYIANGIRVRNCGEAGLFPIYTFNSDDVETNILTSKHTGLSLRQLKGLHGKSGWQMCNLTSINGVAAKTKEEFLLACKAAAIIGTLQAGYCKFPYLGKTTEAIVIREALLGVSMTGILLNPDICLNPEILEEGAKLVVETNKELAAKIGIPQSSRTTMIKPEGTGSLICYDQKWGEVSSGCSPVPAKRYIRRVTAKITEPLFQYFKQHNPHMIEQVDDTTFKICFPIESAATVTKQNLDPVTHLDYIVTLQKHWVLPGTARPERSPGLTHSVSNTVFVGPDEWDAALNAVWDNRDILVGATMYAKGAEGGHQFLPEEPVLTAADEERWNALIRDYVPVPWEECLETEDSTILQQELACAGGACSIV